jgi:hypothetical protein
VHFVVGGTHSRRTSNCEGFSYVQSSIRSGIALGW